MNEGYGRVKAADIRFVSNVPQTLPEWNKEAGGISAFYFRDSDGHSLGLIHFHSGKGQSKWQRPSTKPFLGIDHTGMAVSGTEGSIAFVATTSISELPEASATTTITFASHWPFGMAMIRL
jgi:hypothetical protein